MRKCPPLHQARSSPSERLLGPAERGQSKGQVVQRQPARGGGGGLPLAVSVVQHRRVSRRDSPAQAGGASVLLGTVLWFVTAFAAAAPGSLLYANAESRLPHVAAAALVLAGVIALFLGVTSVRGSS